MTLNASFALTVVSRRLVDRVSPFHMATSNTVYTLVIEEKHPTLITTEMARLFIRMNCIDVSLYSYPGQLRSDRYPFEITVGLTFRITAWLLLVEP
jgi:hypothetical protein